MAEKLKTPVPHKYKAGIFITGDVKQPDGSTRLHVIAPWSEGNYSSNDGQKAYLLPKGTVDEGEGMWEAAVREAGEETGIYVTRVDGDKRPEDEQKLIYNPRNKRHRKWMKNGEEDRFYEGVELEYVLSDDKGKPRPVFEGFVPSGHGNPCKTQMYLVKVKGIENLARHIKQGAHNPESPLVPKTIADISAEKVAAGELPAFSNLMSALRTGYWMWGEEGRGKIFDSSFRFVEKEYFRHKLRDANGELDAVTAARIDNGQIQITTPDELTDLYRVMSQDLGVVDSMKLNIKTIKKHMETLGLIHDHSGVKMEVVNCPLHYYQEGADILPMETWLERMIDFAKAPNHDNYRKSQFNAWISDERPFRHFQGRQFSIAEVVLDTAKAIESLNDKPVIKGKDKLAFKGGSVTTSLGRVIRNADTLEPQIRSLVEQVSKEREESRNVG